METDEVPSRKRKVEFAIDGENDPDSPGDENEDEAPERTGLPHNVSMKQFLAGREEEIKLLRTFLKGKSDKKMTVAQRSLPISMRRRAMSHNAKRFPKRLRTAALIKQIGESKTIKRPSRKYRRKPRNLLAEYIRRQRDHVWLETHVWHAKRFRMSELWGYKIATRCNAKIHRSSYRAVKSEQSCLMTDVSYLNCLELRGSEETLEAGLKELTDGTLPDAREEVNLLFHHPKSTEGVRLIGPVRVLRLPPSTTAGVFWLWVHPSTTEEVLAALLETFSLSKVATVEGSSMVFCPEELKEHVEDESPPTDEPVTNGDVQNGVLKAVANGKGKKKRKKTKKKKKGKENIGLAKLKNKNVPFERTPKYSSPNSDVELMVLKDTLNRFRLIGRGCRAILTEVLRPVKAEQLAESKWFAHFKEDFGASSVESDDLSSLTPGRSALSLVVRDPRALLPPKRLQAAKVEEQDQIEEEEVGDDVVPEESPKSSHWPIVCDRVRDTLISTKVPDSKINALRKALREEGKGVDDLDLGEDEACVPLLVVPVEDYRVSSSYDLDAGLVCDVILPAGWGMSFWIPFVFRNAKVGCLKELSNLCFESSTLVFPRDYPDTNAGRQHRALAMEEAKKEYFKRPPAHRPNYIKMGVFWPFGPKYDELLRLCMPEFHDKPPEDFDVLMDLPRINFLWSLVSYKPLFQVSEKEGSFQVMLDNGEETSVSLKSLVWVKIIPLGKGTLDDLSMVYIPHPSDLTQENEAFDLWEPNHEDILSETRAKLRAEHKAELERAHRHRQRQRRNRCENDDKSKNLPVIKAPKEEDHAEFAAKMHGMFMPDPGIGGAHLKNVREVFGIIERGDYSLARGTGKALALVSCYRLVKMLADQSLVKNVIVLVRGITKSQYVKAELTVL